MSVRSKDLVEKKREKKTFYSFKKTTSSPQKKIMLEFNFQLNVKNDLLKVVFKKKVSFKVYGYTQEYKK